MLTQSGRRGLLADNNPVARQAQDRARVSLPGLTCTPGSAEGFHEVHDGRTQRPLEVVGRVGIEPTTNGLKVQCSTD